MRTRLVLASGLAFAAVALLHGNAAPDDAPAPKDPAAQARGLFASSCAACHQPPDPAFRLDRAWLGQVLHTA